MVGDQSHEALVYTAGNLGDQLSQKPWSSSKVFFLAEYTKEPPRRAEGESEIHEIQNGRLPGRHAVSGCRSARRDGLRLVYHNPVRRLRQGSEL